MFHYSIAPNGIKRYCDKIALCQVLCIPNLEIQGELDGILLDKLTDSDLESARQAFIHSGVRIVISSISANLFDDLSIRCFFRAAHRLHIENILLPAPCTNDLDAYIVNCMKIGKYAYSYGMGLLVTNYPAGILKEEASVAKVVRALEKYHCGILFDSSTYLEDKIAPFFGACYYSRAKDAIRVIRMNDQDWDGKEVLCNEGNGNMREISSLLLSRSFDGYFSLKQDRAVDIRQWQLQLNAVRQMLVKI